jgi:transcriptional accessory protein Tex/SPT6
MTLMKGRLTNERLLSLADATSKNIQNIYNIVNNQATNDDAIMHGNRDLVTEGLADNSRLIDAAGETASDKGIKEEAVEEDVAEEEGVEGVAYYESEDPA